MTIVYFVKLNFFNVLTKNLLAIRLILPRLFTDPGYFSKTF
jgi:hypothetical protein